MTVRVEKFRVTLILLIVIYPLLFIWQGLDFTDMGYWLSGYQKFLSSPESINESLINWLSYAVGYCVEWLAGGFGVIAFKFALVLINWISVFVAYITLRTLFKEKDHTILLFLIFLAMAFITGSTGNWIGYNNLTAVFYLVGASLLYFGIVYPSKGLLFLSGFVLGANLFVRFPNLLGFGLILAIWLFGVAKKWSWKIISYRSAIFIIGYLLGVSCMLLAIIRIGHFEYYIDGLHAIFKMAADNNSHHSGSLLIKMFVRDHFMAFGLAGIIAAAGILLAKLRKFFKGKLEWLVILVAAGITVIVMPVMDMWKWIVTGLCYLVLLSAVFTGFRKNNNLMLLAFIAGLVLLLAPLGSGNGIRNARYGEWLALPLALILLTNTTSLAWKRFHIDKTELQFLGKLAITTMLLFSLVSAYGYTYRDSSNRFAMRHTIDHPLLKGVLTTKERAKVVQELLDALEKYVKPGEELLAYNHIPLIYYLIHANAYLGTSWPQLNSPYITKNLLNIKEKNTDKFPVIVRSSGTTLSRTWPQGNREFHHSQRHDGNRKAFNEFIKRNGYNAVWTNDYFEILKSHLSD